METHSDCPASKSEYIRLNDFGDFSEVLVRFLKVKVGKSNSIRDLTDSWEFKRRYGNSMPEAETL